MFDFFEKILGFIESIWQFFINLINSTILAIETLLSSIILPLELASIVPSILGASVSIVVSLAIVKFIVGR